LLRRKQPVEIQRREQGSKEEAKADAEFLVDLRDNRRDEQGLRNGQAAYEGVLQMLRTLESGFGQKMGKKDAPCAVNSPCVSINEEDASSDDPAIAAVWRDFYPLGDVCLSAVPFFEFNGIVRCLFGG
jgi:hypothetical protein